MFIKILSLLHYVWPLWKISCEPRLLIFEMSHSPVFSFSAVRIWSVNTIIFIFKCKLPLHIKWDFMWYIIFSCQRRHCLHRLGYDFKLSVGYFRSDKIKLIMPFEKLGKKYFHLFNRISFSYFLIKTFLGTSNSKKGTYHPMM